MSYALVGPYGSSSSQMSNIDRNFKPHSIKELEQELSEALHEFIDCQLELYTRRVKESQG